jgi:hypothetical protein
MIPSSFDIDEAQQREQLEAAKAKNVIATGMLYLLFIILIR